MWRDKTDPPKKGDLIVAYFKQFGTTWAGIYTGPKQSFDLWQPLTLPGEAEKKLEECVVCGRMRLTRS